MFPLDQEHELRAFCACIECVYSSSQLFCLTAQANAIDESSGEFVVMWQRKDAVMRTLALLESEQHGNQMRMLLR